MEGDTKHMSSLQADLWTSCKTEERAEDKLYETKLNINNFQNCERSWTTEYCDTMLFDSAVNDESRTQYVKLEYRWPLACTSAEDYANGPGSKPTGSAEFQAEMLERSAFKEEDGAESKGSEVECTTWTLQHSGKLERLNEEAVADIRVDALTPSIEDQTTQFLAAKQEGNAAVVEVGKEVGISPRVYSSAQEESVCGTKRKDRGSPRYAKAIHRCEICSKILPSKFTLQRHIRVHTGEKPFSCQLCQKKFPSMDQLKRHMRLHTGEKPFPCEVCNKSFGTKDHRKKHMTIHTGERNYSCSLCPKTFAVADGLKVHMGVHSGVRPYVCRICPKTFRTIGIRIRHELTHTGEKSHKCSLCPRSFATSGGLKKHASVHSSEKPHPCTVCNKRFKHLIGLNSHMLRHSDEKPFKCSLCSRGFYSSYQLKRHESAVSCDEPVRRKPLKKLRSTDVAVKKSKQQSPKQPSHACFLCQKTFNRPSRLTRHMLVHTDERPFSCAQCPAEFKQADHLSRHVARAHCTTRPYPCHLCKKGIYLQERSPGSSFHSLRRETTCVQGLWQRVL